MEVIRQNIIAFGNARNKPYAQSSLNTYLRNINKLHTAVAGDVVMKDMEWTKDIGALDKAVSGFKPTTQRNYYNSIVIGLMASEKEFHIAPEIRKVYEGKRDLLNAQYDQSKGQPTTNQAKVMANVNKDNILDMIDGTAEKVKGNRMDTIARMMFLIHTEMPFRNELAQIRILREAQYEKTADKNENYLLIRSAGKSSEMKFIMNNGKTTAKYGPRTIHCSPELVKKITAFLKSIDLWKRKYVEPTYLFSWATGKPLTRNDVSHLLAKFSSKHIGHSVSTTLMAKLFNNIPDDINKATADEIQAVQDKALARGHSVKVKATIYNPKV
tara:strand:+ start:2673 stop:3653 length:981 start_codon:yes stop_codon:yes gene_type:complete